MPAKPVRPLNIFIGCPGDMAVERAELLKLRDHLDELGCPVRFLIWKNATPGAGNPQKVIFDNYPIVGWDVFVGLLWTRFGIPSGIKDPLSGEILTGTEAEFAGAYDAFVASSGKRPQVLLYRCTRDLPVDVDIEQLVGVRQFFKQTESGAQRPALTQDFKTAEELSRRVVQDMVKVAERLRTAGKKPAVSGPKAASAIRNAPDWAAAEEVYLGHLIDSHRIVRFHTAEVRQPVEVELEKVFIKLVVTATANYPGKDRVSRYYRNRISKLRRIADHLRSELYRPPTDLELGKEVLLSQKELSKHIKLSLSLGSEGVRPILTTLTLSGLLHLHRHVALAGSPGSGKSTILQYLVLTFASRQQWARLELSEGRVPVLIRLRQFHRWIEQERHSKRLAELKPAHFHEFLAQRWGEEKGAPGLPTGFFERLLRDDRVLILLDGLDEVAEQSQRRDIVALVETALEDWCEARVVLTSRPKAWESEGRAALSGRVGEARICDLDDGQIEEFVHHWYLAATISARGDTPSARGYAESRTVDLIGAVKPDRIRKLAGTPLMLSILAMVHSRGVGLPRERSQLYHECSEFMLGYWDEVQGLEYDPEMQEVARLDRQTKRQLIEPVALWMHRLGSQQIEPGHDDLVREFAGGFKDVLHEPEPAAERHARAFLRLIVERGGLMQESEAGQFRFVHLTFQEYLAASAIAHGPTPLEEIRPHLHDPWWREVILLAGGELSRQRSYRVKIETADWLTGIRDAGTWGEKFLLRDLQLAAQNCAEMSQNGVGLEVTEDLARRLIDASMAEEEGRSVTSVYGFIQGLPEGPLTMAIAAQLRDLPPRGILRYAVPALIVSKFLPAGVSNPPLVDAFKAAMTSQDVEIAWNGAYLYLLHGPAAGRARGVAGLRRVAQQTNRIMTNEEAEKIFALGDDTVAKAIRAWWRKDLVGDDKLHNTRGYNAARLVMYGTQRDREAGLAALAAAVRSQEEPTFGAALEELQELGELADVPEVLAAFEYALRHLEGQSVFDSFRVLAAIVSKRGIQMNVSPLRPFAQDPKSSTWGEAAALILRYGTAEDRAAIRAELEIRIASDDRDYALAAIRILLEHELTPDRPALAARLEQVLARATTQRVRGIQYLAEQLGAVAWTCPHVLASLNSTIEENNTEAAQAISALARLSLVRPTTDVTPTPSIAKLAARSLLLAEIADRADVLSTFTVNHMIFRSAVVRAIQSLSNLPELRTASMS